MLLKPLLGTRLCKRHLAAFKAGPYAAAGTGVLAFVAFARRFAVAGTSDLCLCGKTSLLEPGGRRELVQFHDTRTSLSYASVTSMR